MASLSEYQTALLPVLKDSLRIPRTELDEDFTLNVQVAAAISFVERLTDRVFVNQTWSALAPIPSSQECFSARISSLITTSLNLIYWTPTDAVQDAATGSIDVSSTRVEYAQSVLVLFPPTTGWPQANPSYPYLRLSGTRGTDEAALEAGLKHAIILAAKEFYDGFRNITEQNAIYALAKPYAFYGSMLRG